MQHPPRQHLFTGLFFRAEIATYYQAHSLPLPYPDSARRKILPEQTEKRILNFFHNPEQREAPWEALFRKTSCAVAYAHGEADYNGHYGIRELCDICPETQFGLCASAWKVPDPAIVTEVARTLGAVGDGDVTERAIIVEGLDEPSRYYLQHSYGYQCHDRHQPHHYRRHGRADIGWPTKENIQQ